jgi:hypothetical protein
MHVMCIGLCGSGSHNFQKQLPILDEVVIHTDCAGWGGKGWDEGYMSVVLRLESI